MRNSITLIGLLTLPLFLVASPPGGVAAASHEIRGMAQAVDGDTLEVGGVVLDLRGIDAPEPDQTCERAGKTIPCGDIARWALMDLIAGTDVACRIETTTGNGSAALCTAGGFDISANMVHTGWAVVVAGEGEAYRNTEARARAAGRGLWNGRFVPPEDWRAQTRG